VALRSGVSLDEILEQLRGIRCPSTIRRPNVNCTSCPDAIARVVRRAAALSAEGAGVPVASADKPLRELGADTQYCPDCGALLEHEGGCVACRACGYSKCN
jgi:ribonucleoside-diphosphate reductase alpha chain